MQDQVSKLLANDLSTQENCWQPVDKTVKSGKTTMLNKTGKTTISNDVNGDKSSSLWCHANSFSVLGELYTSCGETEERQSEIISTNKAKHDEQWEIPWSKAININLQIRKPDNIVLHVGTNDTKNRKVTEIMNHIDNLCQEIKEAAPGAEIDQPRREYEI
ncbi:Hypothetical predicted protein [Paramuricea clavata]|uniref:Uncharacterized protein n=1 Tax=Paramuricea clavata TaxID=317549 RepID=A0A7D9KWK9_PARCT|nr:Hypothetical predicted protein [Paramuricea clavata]